MKKEKQVRWRGFHAICVCPLIHHGQQPMRMLTEVKCDFIYVTYKYITIFLSILCSTRQPGFYPTQLFSMFYGKTGIDKISEHLFFSVLYQTESHAVIG